MSQHDDKREKSLFAKFLHVFQYTPRAMGIVWTTSRPLTVLFAVLTLLMGLSPAASAYVGKLIVDQVLLAADSQLSHDAILAIWFVSFEAMIITAEYAAGIGLNVARALLRQQLGHRVNVMILEKSLQLELTQFEDSEFYDKLSQARRGASSRPLNLALGTFTTIQSIITLVSASAILWTFSGWIVPLFLLAALPQFFAQTYFSGESFRLFKWRSPENREQRYLENVIAREDFAKEVKLLGIGEMLLARYVDIFHKVYAEDRRLTILKNVWGLLLQAVTTAAFYGAYIWVVIATIGGEITIGDMTMYIMLIGNGQMAIARTLSSIGSLYDDNLYLSTLYEFLDEPSSEQTGGVEVGADPGAGVVFEDVSFAYPGQTDLAVKNLTLNLLPGERLALVGENGSGKTTLIKLLTGLYAPKTGRIILDGTALPDWNRDALHARISVIFQDFVRYQFIVGENIGVGDVGHFDEEPKWAEAAERGMAAGFIGEMDEGYATRLGRWFKNGRELSGGQWQKIALSRAFMRSDADILIFDEPTSAMDAKAEAEIFERIKAMTDEQMAILISHRFSTVRMADRIVVLDEGRILEAGTHEELVTLGGRYATLFELQAKGYR